MHSDALQKIRFSLRYIEQAPGCELLKLREAYLHWLTHIVETDLPRELLLDFRIVSHDILKLASQSSSETEPRALELIAKLKALEEELS